MQRFLHAKGRTSAICRLSFNYVRALLEISGGNVCVEAQIVVQYCPCYRIACHAGANTIINDVLACAVGFSPFAALHGSGD